MKEYRVERVDLKIAEIIMNDLAKKGWRVVATSCLYTLKVEMVITFEREKTEE